jgi:hypothetical protein
MKKKLPKLPDLLKTKVYKTGQTRGADDDVIYQNRVKRNNTVLIPYAIWVQKFPNFPYPAGEVNFEKGFIVLISPDDYFQSADITSNLKQVGLILGSNCLVFYQSRQEWNKYNPEKLNWASAQKRKAPLGGNYVARVPATTATDGGKKIIHGFTTTSGKGAGIRLFEYASSAIINQCRLQLEAIYWLCFDSMEVALHNGMTNEVAQARKAAILERCQQEGLLDFAKLKEARILNTEGITICPLCLEQLPGKGFFSRMAQAEGREVLDLTVTEINLFHILELTYRVYNHRPYNVGWGHHHCNVVTRDTGILETLKWIKGVLKRNEDGGYKI